MRHPFDLNPEEIESVDLDFEEPISDEEAERVGGGLSIYTSMAFGEEGGDFPDYPRPICPPYPLPFPIDEYPKPLPKPIPWPIPPKPIGPPDVTTLAIGEEGGDPIDTW